MGLIPTVSEFDIRDTGPGGLYAWAGKGKAKQSSCGALFFRATGWGWGQEEMRVNIMCERCALGLTVPQKNY